MTSPSRSIKLINKSQRQLDKLIEAAQNAIEFTVQGRGQFPADMLRYDLCWPAHQADAHSIESWTDLVSESGKPFESRRINLRGLKPPTPGRWASFGWMVEINGVLA
jgi:hypothetical protein